MENIRVVDMPFSQKLKDVLVYYGKINTLEDLLSIDCKKIQSLKSISVNDMIAIKRYVHSIGYFLLNEFLSEYERKDMLRKEGKQVLEDLGISKKKCSYFYEIGIYTLEDVSEVLINRNYPYTIKWISEYRLKEFCDTLEKLGIVFDLNEMVETPKRFLNDNGKLDLSKIDLSSFVVDYLNVSSYVKDSLKEARIYTLEQLLNINYKDLKKIKNMNESKMLELKKCIHSLGVSLKNEEMLIIEKRKLLRNKGVVLLEDLGLSSRVYFILYRNNIYTLEDLFKLGSSVYNIKGLGDARGSELRKFILMHQNSFNYGMDLSFDLDVIQDMVDDIIRQRSELMPFYGEFFNEHLDLKEKELILDRKILKLKKTINNVRRVKEKDLIK